MRKFDVPIQEIMPKVVPHKALACNKYEESPILSGRIPWKLTILDVSAKKSLRVCTDTYTRVFVLQ